MSIKQRLQKLEREVQADGEADYSTWPIFESWEYETDEELDAAVDAHRAEMKAQGKGPGVVIVHGARDDKATDSIRIFVYEDC